MSNIQNIQEEPNITVTFEAWEKAVYTSKEAANYLGIGQSTFWKYVSQGLIPKGIRYSCRKTVWRKKVLDDFIAGFEQEQE